MVDMGVGPELCGWVSPAKRREGQIGFGRLPLPSPAGQGQGGAGWHPPRFSVEDTKAQGRGEAMASKRHGVI